MQSNYQEYKYKFSIVMAIYNVEKYIEEAIESVVNQINIDFKKDVQLILVNDGSPDNSEKICKKYIQKYPDNIIYIKKENAGVSSARNKGLEYIEGKYVNFLDPDDKFELDVLYKVYDFFEINYHNIDLVAIPMKFFEAKSGDHILNYVFKRTRVIDILKDYKCIKLSSSSSFIKSNIMNTFKFKEGMKYAEDAHLLSRILLENLKFGAVSDTVYWYRSREEGSSVTQYGNKTKDWYLYNIKNFSLDMIKYSIEKLGYVPKYIQYVIMYDLQWKINELKNIDKILKGNDKKKFLKDFIYVLKFINYEIILYQSNLKVHRKILICILRITNLKNIQEKVIRLL